MLHIPGTIYILTRNVTLNHLKLNYEIVRTRVPLFMQRQRHNLSGTSQGILFRTTVILTLSNLQSFIVIVSAAYRCSEVLKCM